MTKETIIEEIKRFAIIFLIMAIAVFFCIIFGFFLVNIYLSDTFFGSLLNTLGAVFVLSLAAYLVVKGCE